MGENRRGGDGMLIPGEERGCYTDEGGCLGKAGEVYLMWYLLSLAYDYQGLHLCRVRQYLCGIAMELPRQM